MKKNPKVSIIIPVYNGSNYMKDAIDSALNQTYDNIEVIVVNDGSNDNHKTRNIALSYADKIRYFEKENGGVSSALNLGIEKMTGDYFSWLSHDDMYYPFKIEREIEILKDYNEQTILYSDFELVDGKGKHISYVHEDHQMLMEKPDYAILRGAIGGITLLIPKVAFDKAGLFVCEYRCVQDYEMWFRMSFDYQFVHIPEVLAITRIHAKQDSNTSPLVLSEGNRLWAYMAKEYPIEKKVAYEGSEYLFYRQMADYLRQTPYREAQKEIECLAANILEKDKKLAYSKKVSVVIEYTSESEVVDMIHLLRKQTLCPFEIFVHSKQALNIKNIDCKFNHQSKEKLIKQLKGDYFVFLSAGDRMSREWLEEQVLNLLLTSKGMSFSDFDHYNNQGVIDNIEIISSIPFERIVFDRNKVKSINYENDLDFLYHTLKKYGSTYMDKYYFQQKKTQELSLQNQKILMSLLLNDATVDDYTISSVAYRLSTIYNDTTKGKKVYMYYPCAQYTALLNSRSFKIYQKFLYRRRFMKKFRR